MPSHLRRFLVAVAAVVVFSAVQLASLRTFGTAFDVALAALVVAGMFLDWRQVAVLAAAAFWFLNPYPEVSRELVLFVALPTLFAACRWFVPWRPRAVAAIGIVTLGAVFYTLIDYRLALRELPVLAMDGTVCCAVTLALFEVAARTLGKMHGNSIIG